MESLLITLREQASEQIKDLLAHSEGQRRALDQLIKDDDSLWQILDDPRLVDRVLDPTRPALESFPPSLFFYVLTRHFLRGQGVECRQTAAYVTDMLLRASRRKFTQLEEMTRSLIGLMARDETLSFASGADEIYEVCRFIGDASLFYAGLFPHYIVRHNRLTGLSLEDYEQAGSRSYRVAALAEPAHGPGVNGCLYHLSEKFETVRLGLNDLSGVLIGG